MKEGSKMPQTPYDINEGIPYVGKSLSVKVLDNNRVNIPRGNFDKTIELRHRRKLKNCIFWTYIPEQKESGLVCQLIDYTPQEDFEKYELAEIGNSGIVNLHPDSKKIQHVRFIGQGDHIDIVEAQERKESKRKR